MKIIFLGTSAGLPTKERNTQTTILDLNPLHNTYWMFDVGEGAQHRIMHTSIRLGKLSTIFITHLHGDHLFGLPGLLTSRSFQGGEGKPLTVVGPVGIKAFIETTIQLTASHLNYPLEIIEISNDDTLIIDNIIIKVHELDHGISSYGYRIEMPDVEGGLIVEKLKAIGIEPGPMYRQVKESETFIHNGQQYVSSDFKHPSKNGLKLAFFGDTKPAENEALVCRDVDVMVHESTYLDGDLELSHKYYHSHIKDVAKLAQDNHVKLTLINHVSNRYTDEDLKVLESTLGETYPAFNFRIAHDFDSFEI